MSDTPTCRACGNVELRLGLDLGRQPLANSLLTHQRAMDPVPEPTYPLQVFYCPVCGLIQLLDIVKRSEMFDDYTFLTASAETSLHHFDEYADLLTHMVPLKAGDLVVDIGSNDGTLLKAFKRRGAAIVGIEPAQNVAKRAISEGVNTLIEYFGSATVEKVGPGEAKLVTANNVVSHVGDLHGFIDSVGLLLDRRGLFAFEVPWVVDVLQHRNFDIIYHEHLSYFGFKPLSRLLERHDLELVGLRHFPDIHGGTLRGLAAHRNRFPIETDALRRVFAEEDRNANFESLKHFASAVQETGAKLVELLQLLKSQGKRIVGYGAPAKATVLLNYCSIDRSTLDFVTDSTPLKQGKFIPGVRIPIVPPDEFRKSNPDYALLLAWNFKDEIVNKEQDYLRSGGRFIVPFPEPTIIGEPPRTVVKS